MRDASLATNPASTAPGVETWNVFDLFARRALTTALQVSGGVNNVADREPPIVRGQPGTTEQSTYDIFGRTYYVALTAQF
jgi:outer membrane receptor protein involved in Fe transport